MTKDEANAIRRKYHMRLHEVNEDMGYAEYQTAPMIFCYELEELADRELYEIGPYDPMFFAHPMPQRQRRYVMSIELEWYVEWAGSEARLKEQK